MLYPGDVAMPPSQLGDVGTQMAAGGGGWGGDAAGAMVEMGLTSESGMDAAWLAFIQQCGVTLGSSPGESNSLYD